MRELSSTKLGIDIGSKTIKVTLLRDPENTLIYSSYVYHLSKVRINLLNSIRKIIEKYGDIETRVVVTGSAGMRIAELLGMPFVQEVVALKRSMEVFEPACDVVLEMGGEDTKLVYLSGTFEQRMNTVCAGGTGGFIDMMAGLMGRRSSDMQRLALGATTIYPIASRCAVFAKSDVRPLLNAGASKEDIAASVLHAVCEQAVAGLSAGRPIQGNDVLLGGPFHYIPALADAFCAVTGLPRENVRIPDNAHLFVARGAALYAASSPAILLSRFEQMLAEADFSNEEGIKRLPSLFSGVDEYECFKARHAVCSIPRAQVERVTEGNYFLGIDAGSTTMKMALVDENGALVTYAYDWNRGDLSESFPWMLKRMYRTSGIERATKAYLRRSCVIGYGEDYCREAFFVDTGEVETVAHLRAATQIEPEVDFLIDIGGQDIKCFYVRDGQIEDLVLNEACSSGCGSLFDSVARSMRLSKESLVEKALYAKLPVDLGTRCSTFMDSRVKHAQKEGASQGDIAAGIAYSTARNALFKVVRRPDFSKVGEHIVVQGGAFANDALLRAFELETKTQVKRPDLAQLMGAWGAALLARDEWLSLRELDPHTADEQTSSLLSSDQLDAMKIRRQVKRCELCANKCQLVVTHFCKDRYDKQGHVLVAGNRCDRGAAAQSDARMRSNIPPNLIKLKNALLDQRDREQQPQSSTVVGIPKALTLYESYPFWKSFFNELGYTVVSSGPSSDAIFRKGMSAIFAEGSCYPSKLVFGHCIDCIERGANLLFLPKLSVQVARTVLGGGVMERPLRECPLIENMSDLIGANRVGVLEDTDCLCPDLLEVTCIQDMPSILKEACAKAGIEVELDELQRALECAAQAQRTFFDTLQETCDKVFTRVDAGEFPGMLVIGHGYHADPGIHHGIDELLGKLGYAVIERLNYRCCEESRADADVDEWQENHDASVAVEQSIAHPGLSVIICRSFGCGIDALVADDIHERLRGLGRMFAELKIDQITDLAAIRIRLRSLDYARRANEGIGADLFWRDVEENGRYSSDIAEDAPAKRESTRTWTSFRKGFGGSDVSQLPNMVDVPDVLPPGELGH